MNKTTIRPLHRLAAMLVLASCSSFAAAADTGATPADTATQAQAQDSPAQVATAAELAAPEGTVPAQEAMTRAALFPNLGLRVLLGMETEEAGC